mgnify:CR=1 FL=1
MYLFQRTTEYILYAIAAETLPESHERNDMATILRSGDVYIQNRKGGKILETDEGYQFQYLPEYLNNLQRKLLLCETRSASFLFQPLSDRVIVIHILIITYRVYI